MPPISSLPFRLPTLRILVLGLVLGLLGLVAVPTLAEAAPKQSSTAESRSSDGVTMVYGIPGLTIDDIDPKTTPNLYGLVRDGAAANLNVRTIGSATCPGSGWMSFGAGARAEAGPPAPEENDDEDRTARCPMMDAPTTADSSDEDLAGKSASDTASASGTTTATIEDFDAIKAPNVDTGYSVDYGMLSRLVREQNQDHAADSTLEPCVAAEGTGAAYAVADETGTVHDFTDDAAAANCRLGVVDLGAIGSRSWLFDPIPNYSYTVPAFYDREKRVAEADRRLGDKLADLKENATPGSGEPTVIVAGLGDSSGLPQLRAFVASGPGFEPGTVSSATTRTPGLLQLTDLAPSILHRLGVGAPSGVSFDVTPSDDDAQTRIDDLVNEAQKSTTIYQHLSTFSLFLDIVFYLLFIACGLLLSRSILARRGGATVAPHVHRSLGWVSFGIATLPMGAFIAGLFPWARLPQPGLGLSVAVAVSCVIVFAVSMVPPWGRSWRGRVGALALISVVIIGVDLVTGSRLQGNSLLGYNPIVGGRFYGLGNQGAAIFIVGLFIFLGLAISWLRVRGHRRMVIVLPVVLGLLAVLVSGNPSWGAKFGGTIATLAGLLVLLALISGIRLSFLRLVLIGAASLAVLIGIAFLDWLRAPGARSHFGNFFDQLVSGEAFQVIGRKLGANLHIIQVNPALAIVTPLAVIAILLFLRYLLVFPGVSPSTRSGRLANRWQGRLPQVFEDRDIHYGFLAAVTGLAVGLVITDSGIAVPSTGAMVLLPYLLALSAEHAEARVTKTKIAKTGVAKKGAER